MILLALSSNAYCIEDVSKQSDAWLALEADIDKSLLAAQETLNLLHKKILQKIDPSSRSQFQEAARAWTQYRDAYSAFEAMRPQCDTKRGFCAKYVKKSMTEYHILELKTQFDELD
jgi:uncharacterized protein YecT (DUF1311 family)